MDEKISDQQRLDLDKPFAEVRTALFQIEGSKDPDADGYVAAFLSAKLGSGKEGDHSSRKVFLQSGFMLKEFIHI